jgi:hypothetical protein
MSTGGDATMSGAIGATLATFRTGVRPPGGLNPAPVLLTDKRLWLSGGRDQIGFACARCRAPLTSFDLYR